MLPEKTLLSIIVPCYNSELYLAETLDSVLSQTYTHWECIIVDDKSKDASVQIANSYCEAHPGKIRVYSNHSKGACAARNMGIDLSHGSYIKFLDSDDALFDENVLGSQIGFLEQHNYDIVYGDEYYYQDTFNDSTQIKKRGCGINDPASFYENFPITSNFLIKRSSLNGLKWNEKLKSGQEFFLLFQCFARNMEFGYQALAISKIRVHNSVHRISNKSSKQHISQLLDLVDEMTNEIKALKISDKAFLKQYKKQILLSVFQAVKAKENKAAAELHAYLDAFKDISLDQPVWMLIYRSSSISSNLAYWIYKVYSYAGRRFS
ncbi:glycosyltransferase family 2 protein [Mucilaginibacter sp. Bleaf8]|uniref:glycosyltransferase family 2 protein n=1 Tax=Mucilaginibacter sp. Bleaf8 TaxID=2834430 RepID=UPI001BCF1B1A|nr:glycosyltransferase family 2 protein [Mucilaginibacter sp. Bleaf8]MBS7566452.1 glycosyltransferase family 2 protein [Mucilaginibacter sp. Bleaf8]